MFRQEDLFFIKAVSTLQLSPALKEMRMALVSRKKKTLVSAGSRSTALGVGSKASQCPSSQHAGKRKANVLASSDDSIKPANRRPGAGSAPLSAISSVTPN